MVLESRHLGPIFRNEIAINGGPLFTGHAHEASPRNQRAGWGGFRFARFVALSVLFGNLATIAIDMALPPGAQERFHPAFVYGPGAAIAAIAVAWSREYPDSTVNLFFVLPLRARYPADRGSVRG